MLMLTEPAQAGEGIETTARWQPPFTGRTSLSDAAPQPNQTGAMWACLPWLPSLSWRQAGWTEMINTKVLPVCYQQFRKQTLISLKKIQSSETR